MSGLNIKNLTVGYEKKIILEDLNLEVKEDEDLVLMGTSGSGKTTLLLAILGILPLKSGQIILNGKEIQNLPIEKRNIGYLPQDYGLFPHLTVIENVSYGLRIRGVSKIEQTKKAQEMLEFVQLKDFDKRKISELSGGQRQRVGLARALAIKPDLFLFDEPLSNIDQVTKLEVASHLKNFFLKLNIPMILVTHNHEDAIFLSKQLAIMIDGKIEQIGRVDEILNNPKTPFIKKLLVPYAEI